MYLVTRNKIYLLYYGQHVNPLDFTMWGQLKERVCVLLVNNIGQLHQRYLSILNY